MTNRAGNAMLGGSDSVGSSGTHPKKGTTAGNQASAATVRIYYKMIADPVVGTDPVTWVVVGTADTTGSFATAAFVPNTVRVAAILHI